VSAENPRRFRRRPTVLAAIGAATALLAGFTIFAAAQSAHAATLLSDNFEDGNHSGWSSSGGSWAVVSDGSMVDRQSNSGSERARHFNGSTSWTNYTVQARVRPLAFNGSNRVVALVSRVSSSTRMYRLALINANRAELQAMNGSAVTVLGSANLTVSTGTWYTLRMTVNGNSISGTVNGTSVGSTSSTANTAGRVGFYTEFASASFDDISVDTVGSQPPSDPPTSPPSNPPSSPPSNPNPQPQPGGLVGWGTQGGGTSGGGGASAVTVTSASALTSAIAGTNASVIRVSGTISCSGMLRVGSNKSILGNSGATIAGCGLNVAEANNVIIRNINFRDWNDDAINVQYSTRVWIDHNSFTGGNDGAVDIKRSSDFITVSWNRVFGHDKSMLLGHDDGNGSEDIGHLRVTYHHNWFDGSNQRHPRVRFGNPVHVYNNLYSNVGSYGVASTEGAGVLVEGNYFENTEDPFHLGEGDSGPGTLVARNNHFVNSGAGQSGGSVAGIPYSYGLDTASAVKGIVSAGAGAGRITV
jgi:pectate lyase